jgi:HAD superfamily hydrolase (TIGR01509 family)
VVRAVVFDLDGVLLDSERVWDDARRDFVAETGGTWNDTATGDMMGMSSPEWSCYLHDRLHVPMPALEISTSVAERVLTRYSHELPLVPNAIDTVRAFAARWPLALASSSNREVIEQFLDASGLRPCFGATVSSEEVAHGKPAPDVYARAVAELRTAARDSAAVEDSTNGIRSARAAGLRVVAVPNTHFPPDADVLASADAVVTTLSDLTPELVERVGAG